MRKIILTLVGAALLATSTSDIALSKERHHFRNAQQRITERSRDTNAYAAPYYVPNTRPSYSGLDGAWGAMTGFD